MELAQPMKQQPVKASRRRVTVKKECHRNIVVIRGMSRDLWTLQEQVGPVFVEAACIDQVVAVRVVILLLEAVNQKRFKAIYHLSGRHAILTSFNNDSSKPAFNSVEQVFWRKR